MPKEVSGVMVTGDASIITYVKHVGNSREAAAHQCSIRELDDKNVFCSGSKDVGKWLQSKVDAFVSKNLLEPPEDTVSFQPAERPAKGKGKRQKRAAPAD
mmetsp:Transcript_104367/g.248335  ORF Transcript_104367/g.248335 Transcript_104367/m.248335 type:complete len:100 (-) Transcript_104367:1-300(-)